MKFARLGDSGLIVSRLALGTMTFTAGDASMPGIYKTGESLATEMVAKAFDKGVNFFDTADAYAGGQSEEILGRALGARRNDAIIATKVGFRSGTALAESGLSARHILKSVDQSLNRLGTDWIDLYIVHREDPLTPLEETLGALDQTVRAGKVRYIGLSNWSAWKSAAAIEFQRANGLAQFRVGQMHYSLTGRDVERDVIPMMRRYGVGMMVWSPLASGFLSGKYTPETLDQEDGRLSSFDLLPFDKTEGFKVVEALRQIATERGCSVSQAALAWLLAKEAATSVLVGASKMSHLDDNLGAADLALSAEEVARLDAIMPPAPVYPNWFIDNLVDPDQTAALGG